MNTSQRFEYREILRSSITLDPSNPRSIAPIARKRLKKKIEEVGCVTPLVWNEKNGLLCSGHQRLSIMDEIEGYPLKDYLVAVSVVRLTDKQHAALCIFLNNAGAQGQFEKDPFLKLLKEVSLEDIGFTKVDLEFEFGELPDLDIFAGSRKATKPVADQIKAIKERKEKVRREHAAADGNLSVDEDADYFVLVAWNSRREKEEFLAANGKPADCKVMSAEEFIALCACLEVR